MELYNYFHDGKYYDQSNPKYRKEKFTIKPSKKPKDQIIQKLKKKYLKKIINKIGANDNELL